MQNHVLPHSFVFKTGRKDCNDGSSHKTEKKEALADEHFNGTMTVRFMEDQFDLECSPQSSSDGARKDQIDSSHDVISVIDVLKSDEEGNSSCLRGTYYGCWHGLYAEAVGEIEMNNSIGSVLESWTDTTLAGLSVTNTKQSSLSDENIFESVHPMLVATWY